MNDYTLFCRQNCILKNIQDILTSPPNLINESYRIFLFQWEEDFRFCQTPVLGLGLGLDFTFAWDNHNNHNNPHLNFVKRTALAVRAKSRLRDTITKT